MPPSFACVPSQSHLNINPAAVTSPKTSTATTTDVSNVYQVDYTCVNAGKKLGMTKRRVRFRFGFADTQALLSGEKAGADCRGEEHEIIINWSLASGKQQVLCDGHEIFYEVRPRESVLTCAWRFRGNHVLKVVGYAKPSTMRQAGTKQFNIFLDEVSFYDFLPIYAIGTRPSSSASYYPEKNYRPVVSHSNREQYNIDTEGANEYYDEKGLQQQQAVTTPSTVASFQSYEGESGEPNNNNSASNYADLLDMADDSVVYYNTTVPPSQQQQQQLPVNDPFSYPPAAVEVDPENERRSKLAEINQQLTMAIQNTHISAPPPPMNTTHAIVPSQTQSSYYASEAYSTNASYPSQEPAPVAAPVPVLLDENQDTSNTEEKSGDNAFDDMVKKLVNVEDITSEPEHLQNSKLSMKPLLEKKKNASNKQQQQESYGPQPTLSQLKAVSSSSTVTGPNNNKEIMKPSNHLPNNNNVSYQGALVVHGASSPHYNHAHQDMNSAPPLMRQVGFGVGASYQQQYGQAPQQAYYARSG